MEEEFIKEIPPTEIRPQAIKDLRDVNLQLSVVAEARAILGISA